MSAAYATRVITPRRASKIEIADSLSLADLSVWSSVSMSKLYAHTREAVDPLPMFQMGRKIYVSKKDFESWRARRFSSVRTDPAIVAPRPRRRKTRA